MTSMMRERNTRLHALIGAVCPIDGLKIPNWNDKSGWEIHFAPQATDQEKSEAQAVLDAFEI